MTRVPKHPIRPQVPFAEAGARPSGQPGPLEFGTHVRARSVGPVVVLDVAGRLGDVVDKVDLAARFSLAEGPRGVVCDLSSVVAVNAPGALRGLASSGRHPRDWPGVPLAVVGLAQRAGNTLSGTPLGGHLMVTASLRQALSSVLQASLPTVASLRLTPHPTAARASRDFVSRTLLDWRLSRLICSACLVVSELATNAMIHAGTDSELTVAVYGQAVRISVRDGSPALPVERHGRLETHGRGLAIVSRLSSAWGVLPTAEGGKVVWAVLGPARLERVASRARTNPADPRKGART